MAETEILDYDCCVFFGPRRSGKSSLMKKVLRSKMIDIYDNIYILSPSLDCNGDYDEFAEEKTITLISEPTPDHINAIFSQQKRLKQAQRTNPDGGICPSTLVILDDIIDSHLVQNFGVVDKLAERGRHIDIGVFILVQKLSAASRSIRLNADLMFMFAPFSISETEQFLEQFVSRANKKAMYALLEDLFQYPYIFLIIDNHEPNPCLKLKYSDRDHFLEGDVKQIDLRQLAGAEERLY